MTSASYLAIDMGAESGRAILGQLKGGHLNIQEVHRFSNGGVRCGDHLHWDVQHLWAEIKSGLLLGVSKDGVELKSIGLDTWGVDFGLLDVQDKLVENPYHYRDRRTDGMPEAVFEIFPREKVYAQTGIQFMQLNSLFQLYAMVRTADPVLSAAKTFLNMPDLFNFYLTGEKVSEFTIATTTQCYDPIKQEWASGLLSTLGIPGQIFKEIVLPGTILGQLQSSLVRELRVPGVSVIAIASHDTASAIAAVPAICPDYLYLSSGTWSLMGVELDQPIINPASLQANLTNEGGLGRKICFLKNIVGLWLLQECRRQWQQTGVDLGYAELNEIACSESAFGFLINPADPRFLAPENMTKAIQAYCQDTGQPVPNQKGEIVRCILESLALEYRWVADQIDHITGKEHPVIHIIGGGSQNKLLNQFTANATGRTVVAGPVEATAIGNILVQAMAMGEISSLTEGREIVRHSFDTQTFSPQIVSAWDHAWQRFLMLKEGNQF